MDKEYVSTLFTNKRIEFNNKFTEVFENENNVFLKKGKKYIYKDAKVTAQSAMSTLFSNILYMNGNLQIVDTINKSVKLSKQVELLTIGPDKTSHSRGFMWDEGFQQRILSLWNLDLSLRVVTNWFKNIDDESGWLPREQCLDNESRSRAPPSSWASIPDVANPPSLYLFMEDLFERKIEENILKTFFDGIIENLEKMQNGILILKNLQRNMFILGKVKQMIFVCLRD